MTKKRSPKPNGRHPNGRQSTPRKKPESAPRPNSAPRTAPAATPALRSRSRALSPKEAPTEARAKTPTKGADPARFPVVGIGASAGGLAALEEFFTHVPVETGMAFIVITHQAPGRATLLPELLARHAKIPVVAASHHMQLKPDQIHVAPPGCYLSVSDERLNVQIKDGAPSLPIDHLFRSMAHNEGEQAIGIVLSGTGTDGSLGIVEIKGAGGMAVAQEPQSAQYPGMPSSAIATRLVDYRLTPAAMPKQLVQYVRDRARVPLQHVDHDGDTRDALNRILITLRNRTGSDFTAYKRSTIGRRIERRIGVHGLHSVAEYAALLDKTPYEVDALFKELLISVTSFFRDPEAFAKLEEELTTMIRSMAEGSTFRAWVAGCATGEEAYSIAILLREAIERSQRDIKVQIFATDLDPQAIDIARLGRYPDGIAADVKPERLQRFFTHKESGYRINKDVREILVFAVQNVIKDPPFTKLDLVSCRNLLIYLEPDLQRRVLGMFSYALRAHGVLMLGTSESVGSFDDRFAMLDKRWKVFQRRSLGEDIAPFDFPSGLPPTPRSLQRMPVKEQGRSTVTGFAERVLLTTFVPPTVIISERGELMYLHGQTGQFLEPVQGEPTHNAFGMAREGLRLELPAAVRQAAIAKAPIVRRGLQVKTNGGYSPVTLVARKLTEPELLRGAFMVSFEIEAPAEPAPKSKPTQRQHKQVQRISGLEDELRHTRENLQGTIEALETSNEELKSTNEELQSTNEELQSANEELETSREEMQSLNEELQTVNAELGERNRALSQVNDDMQNLLNSTDVATLFLDDKLAIKRFTTQARKVFSLIETDVGRPISDLAVNLQYDQLDSDAREVLRTLVFREREIQTKAGSWRLMRIMPYRTHENLIDGLVITFVDIDRLKRAELDAQRGRQYAEGIIGSVNQALLVMDNELRVVTANPAFLRMFGLGARSLAREPVTRVLETALDDAELHRQLQQLFDPSTSATGFQVKRFLPRLGPLVFSAHRITTTAGEPEYALIAAESARDEETGHETGHGSEHG